MLTEQAKRTPEGQLVKVTDDGLNLKKSTTYDRRTEQRSIQQTFVWAICLEQRGS